MHLIDLNTVSCPKVNLYFGFWIWSKLSAKPEEIRGRGWKREMEKRKDDQSRFVIYLWSQREKKLHHLKLSLLSQKGKHGLPSLKWHSHVLPASAAFSLESEWGLLKEKKLLKHVEKKSHHLTLQPLLFSDTCQQEIMILLLLTESRKAKEECWKNTKGNHTYIFGYILLF